MLFGDGIIADIGYVDQKAKYCSPLKIRQEFIISFYAEEMIVAIENIQENVDSISRFNELVRSKPAMLTYLSTKECNVCKSLRPKIEKMITEQFSEMEFHYVDCDDEKELAAQLSVFTVPTILIFFDGRESIRKSRFVGVEELRSEISRIYEMMFS